MAALLAALLLLAPADSTVDRDHCLSLLPTTAQEDLSVSSHSEAQQVWTGERAVSRDTLRAEIQQIREARRCFEALPAADRRPYRDLVYSLQWEAPLQAALRQFSKAFGAYDQAESLLQKDLLPPDSAAEVRAELLPQIYQNRGYLHFLQGDLAEAIEHYLAALQRIPEAQRRQRAGLLMDVGILHQRTQDYRSAGYYYERARRLLEEGSPPRDSQSWSRLLSVQADLLLEKTLNTRFDRDSLRRARDLARRGRAAAAPATERRARVSLALSESLGYLESFDRAYALNEEARRYARTHDDAPLRAFALLKLGVLHMQTHRWTDAESALTTSLSIAEQLGNLDYQRRIRRGLGRLHELRGNWAAAETHYRQGVRVIEQYRESLTTTQWSSTAFAQWRDVHRGLVRTLLAQDRPRAALAALDRTRARHLQDLRTQARVSNELPAPTRVRFDSLSRTLADVRTRLGTDSLSNVEQANLHAREASLLSARQRILQLDSSATSRPSLDDISASLGRRGRALVSYFLDDPWPVYDRSPRSVAFILTADTLRTVALPALTQDSVRSHVASVSPLFTSPKTAGGANAMHFDLRPLRVLHDALYAPVAEHLPDGQPLTVIPDGPMFHVPFSMLVTAAPGGRYDHADARFVLHERPTALDLSSSLVADTSATWKEASFSPDLAAFGVSSFDSSRPLPSALQSPRSDTAAAPTASLPPLPGVRSELRTLGRLFDDAATFLDERATESRFASVSRRAGVVHLASHAFVHPTAPLQNAFLLHPDSSSDGLLFLHELQTRGRPLPLAVLSGCNTARGTLRGGEGMAGLQYAFRAMGAASTVSTLWPTADRPNVALMKRFYQNLQAGMTKDRALRQAKLTYRANHPDHASPFFWGSAVVYGSSRPVPLESSREASTWMWWALGLVLGTALLAWLWARIRSRYNPIT